MLRKHTYTVDQIALPLAAANVLRELAMHLGTPSPAINKLRIRTVRSLITALGVDPDDRRITNYNARLHLPLFVLATAVAATVLCERLPKLVAPILGVLLFSALLPTVGNEPRPLLFTGRISHPVIYRDSILTRNRAELYFSETPKLQSVYVPAAETIRKEQCSDVGLDRSASGSPREYALIAQIKNEQPGIRIRYVGVDNLSSQFADENDRRQPCVVVCIDCRDRPDKVSEYSTALPRLQTFGTLVVFNPRSE